MDILIASDIILFKCVVVVSDRVGELSKIGMPSHLFLNFSVVQKQYLNIRAFLYITLTFRFIRVYTRFRNCYPLLTFKMLYFGQASKYYTRISDNEHGYTM